MSNPKKMSKFVRLNGEPKLNFNSVFMNELDEIMIFEDDLAKLFKVSKRMLQKYKEEKGLEHHKSSVKGAVVYDLVYAIKWYFACTDKLLITRQVAPVKENSGHELITKMNKLDHDIKEQKLKTDKLKHDELNKTLVKAEDLDRSMAEQAVLHKTYYVDDLELLPIALDGMKKDEISEFLNEHYTARLENASSFIQKLFDKPNFLYNKIMELLK